MGWKAERQAGRRKAAEERQKKFDARDFKEKLRQAGTKHRLKLLTRKAEK